MRDISKYIIKIKMNDERTLLFNMLTKDKILLENQFLEDLTLLEEYKINELKERYFIFNNQNEEQDSFTAIRSAYLFSDTIARFVVHLNYDCNLTCSYCYQNVIEEKTIMSMQTAKEVGLFIKKVAKQNKPEMIDICFIGGEPMLHTDLIEIVMNSLENLNGEIYLSMVTNGTILGKRFKTICDLGIKDFMITLDGPKIIHDNFRKNKSGKGSFDKILKNLKRIQKEYPDIRVQINCNLNNENLAHIQILVDELKENEIKYPLIFSDVIDIKGTKFNFTLCEDDLHWLEVHEMAMDVGYMYQPFYRDTFLGCSMFQKNNFNIGADGYLYSCIEAVGVLEYRQISIKEYGTFLFDFIRSQVQGKKSYSEKCKSCEFLPNCDGGCYYKIESGNFKCPRKKFQENEIPLINRIFKEDI